MVITVITGFVDASGGGGPKKFSDFFCHHVERVRRIVPTNNLVEIDIEDPDSGRMMSEIFDIDMGCWGRANVNSNLHRGIDTGRNGRVPHLMWGRSMIRSKNGTMRKRPLPMY